LNSLFYNTIKCNYYFRNTNGGRHFWNEDLALVEPLPRAERKREGETESAEYVHTSADELSNSAYETEEVVTTADVFDVDAQTPVKYEMEELDGDAFVAEEVEVKGNDAKKPIIRKKITSKVSTEKTSVAKATTAKATTSKVTTTEATTPKSTARTTSEKKQAAKRDLPTVGERSSENLPVITFLSSSDAIPNDQYDNLALVGTFLRNHPRSQLVVHGSEERCKAVVKALTRRYGIVSRRLTIDAVTNAKAVTFKTK